MYKKLKDPIYGYVCIPVEYMTNIIDTAEFQRLRRVIQTSYSPLYSSAIHNRFVHSIGVFYLGTIASAQLADEIVRKNFMSKSQVDKIVSVYRLACLLHDVGHAPFSHTGEGFYKYKNGIYSSLELHDRIGDLVGNSTFKKCLKKRESKETKRESKEETKESKAAAPHELMSVIVGLKNFGDFLKTSKDKELFARCITGYVYEDNSKESQIKNCFITMLNSKVIDVDRLDYLIRDAYITGFETINLDYNRLLKALTVVYHENKYQIAYKKDALSIIENAVYAHDAEKKWIQNHPTVLYEAYIIKHIIMHLNEKLNDDEKNIRLFSEEALSKEGICLKEGVKVSLLCDDDIIYLYKNIFPDELSSEFLDRKNRRHPILKSEAEYRGYIDDLSEKKLKKIFDDYIATMTKGAFEDIPSFDVINDDYINKIEKELQDAQATQKKLKNIKKTVPADKESVENNIQGIKRRLAFYSRLKKFADANNIECDFVILKADIFNSNFSKEYLVKTLIVFKDGEEENVYPINTVCNTLTAEKVDGDMFYIYYRKKNDTEIEGIRNFCMNLFLDTVRAE